MPDNMNPYMDSGMNPNGFVPNYGQPGFAEEANPFAQQPGWDPNQMGMMQPGFPGAPQPMGEEFVNPGAMASPQDIYANQAAQMGAMPGQFGAPFPDPAMGGMPGQPFADPYGQQAQPGFPGAQQPMFDPMQQQMPGQTGQQAPISPAQTGGFENPMQQAAAMQAAEAKAMQAAEAQQAAQIQQMQAAQQQVKQQAAGKKGKRPQSQMQPMPVVGAPVVNPKKATGGRAKLALILSIFAIIFALVPPLGLVLSIVARKIATSYKKNGGRSGAGDAAGVFSIVAIVFSIVTCGILIWFIGYVNGATYGTKAYGNPITFFNNSPLGSIFKIVVS